MTLVARLIVGDLGHVDTSILTPTATFLLVSAAIASIAITNWPRAETPHRRLDDAPESPQRR